MHEALIAHGSVRAFTDLKTLLQNLKRSRMFLGVATSDDDPTTWHCLRALQVETCFDCVLTADQVARPKPASDMLDAFCGACALTPSAVMMVGDSENDMLFAERNGAHGVLFRPRAQRCEKTCATCRITDLAQLPDLVAKFSIL